MIEQYIIQKNSDTNPRLVSELEAFGEPHSAIELATFDTREACHEIIRKLLSANPNNGPYKSIRMFFDE